MRCPECGSRMRKGKKRGKNIYECPNPKCPVIEVRIFRRGRYRKVVMDSILYSREVKISE